MIFPGMTYMLDNIAARVITVTTDVESARTIIEFEMFGMRLYCDERMFHKHIAKATSLDSGITLDAA